MRVIRAVNFPTSVDPLPVTVIVRQRLQPGGNPFDKLPDELISRIFTIGTEYSLSENEDARHDAGTNLTLKRRPYKSIGLVSSVCRRFHSITRLKSNAHFFYIKATISQGGGGTQRVNVAPFHWALKTSEGCDIVLDIELWGSWDTATSNQEQELYTRLTLHALRSLIPYKRQLISIDMYIFDRSLPLLLWIMRWLGTLDSFRRLQHLSLHFSGESAETSSIDTFLFDDYSSPIVTDVIFDFPSLARLAIVVPNPPPCRVPILSRPFCLRTLSLYPKSDCHSFRLFYDWASIASIIMTCPTLRHLDFALWNAEPLQIVSPTAECYLEELAILLDSQSLVTVFQTFLFPHLKTAQLFIPGISLPMITPHNCRATSRFAFHPSNISNSRIYPPNRPCSCNHLCFRI